MKPHLKRRVQALQALMGPAGLDAVLFADRENCIYYLGATDIECLAVVIPAAGDPVACCLWLDAPSVKERSGLDDILAYRFPAASIGQTVVKALRTLGLTAPRVGFHKYFVEFGVFDALRTAFPDMVFRPAMDLTYRVRAVKDPEELSRMERACSFLDIGMEAAVAAVRPGLTEVQVLAEADYAMRKAGSEGATFRMQVLNQDRQLLAHPYAGQDPIRDDQAVVIHLGASYRGYAAKLCRTVFLGRFREESLRICRVLRQAQELAAAGLVPGRQVSDLYEEVRAFVDAQGYRGLLLDHLGYGVGIRQSEFHPIVGKGLDHVLEQDMVVDLLLPTIAKPGVGGPRITDMLHVTDRGGRYMTRFGRDPIVTGAA